MNNRNKIRKILILSLCIFLFENGSTLNLTKQSIGNDESLNLNISQRNYKVGIGPIPRNFPSNQEGWLDMFEKVPEVGEIVIAQSEWRDSIEKSGEIPEIVQLVGTMKNKYGYTPQFGINFFQGEGKSVLNIKNNHVNNRTNEDAKQKYKETALKICRNYNPEYLALGIEVNTYYQHHPGDFDRFVLVYKEIYDEIKSIYPGTKVFVTFQLEKMKGIGDKTFGAEIEPHWNLIDKFGDKLDLVAFTTYPEVEFDSPDKLPDDYYLEIREHTNKKIAFTEIGWQSTKRTEKDQNDFILRFIHLTKELDIECVNWVFMHDLPGFGPLKKVGLRKSNGDPKQSWFTWKKLKRIPLEINGVNKNDKKKF